MIIWLTGQPGAGKTVLAKLLIENLVADFHIDGDDLRALTANKNYGIKGRIENVGRAQTIAHYLHNVTEDVVVSLVSPYIDQREEFKTLLGDNITEIYVHTTEPRERDHYHVKNYQAPQENFLSIDTTEDTPEESLEKIMDYLRE
jgi:adenylylsulfate kinase